MATHSSLHEELESLRRQVRQLEADIERQKLRKQHLKTLIPWYRGWTQGEWEEVFGWFLLAATSIPLVSQWISNASVNWLLALWMGLGLWLVLRAQVSLGMSDSSRQLLLEQRASGARHAHHLHHGLRHRVRQVSWAVSLKNNPDLTFWATIGIFALLSYLVVVLTIINQPSWQGFALILPVGIGFAVLQSREEWRRWMTLWAGLAYLVLAANLSPLFSVLALVIVSTGLLFYAWKNENWTVHLLTVVGSYSVIGRWILYYQDSVAPYGLKAIADWRAEWLAMNTAVFLFALLFFLPFLGRRREMRYRETIRLIFVGNLLGFLLTAAWLGLPIMGEHWFVTFSLSIMSITVGLGYIAWLAHGRLSYAKYFYVLALFSAICLGVMRFDPVLVSAWLFCLMAAAIAAGFYARSYSARLTGYGLSALTVGYYTVTVLPQIPLLTDAVSKFSVIWMGLMIAVYLLSLGFWVSLYGQRGEERRYQQVLEGSLTIVAFALVLALIGLSFTSALASVIWMAFALLSAWFGYIRRYQILRFAGEVVFFYGLGKLLLIDAMDFAPVVQVTTVLLVGCLVILGSWYFLIRPELNHKRRLARRHYS